jgi:hypothetical protein
LERQGYEAAKKCSLTTDLEEIEDNVEKLTLQRDLDNSIKLQRKILVGFATVVEGVCENEDYNIFELELQGWSESVYENISEYDEVFEELFLKYRDVAHIPPEFKLIGMVAGSAWMFHMSRNMFGKAAAKVPGFPDVMKADPELRRRYQEVAANLARNKGMPVPNKGGDGISGFIGKMFGSKSGDQPAPQRQPPQQSSQRPPVQRPQQSNQRPPPVQRPQQSRPPPVQRPQQGQPPQRDRLHRQPPPPHQAPTEQSSPPPRIKRQPMHEPEDVDNLLGSLTGVQNNDTIEEDEIDLSAIDSYGDLS